MIIRYIILLFIVTVLVGCSLNEDKIGTVEVEKNQIISEIEKIEQIQVIEVEDYSDLTDDKISQIEQLKEIGRRMHKLNQYDKSIEAYLKVLVIHERDFEAYYRLGNNYQNLGLYNKAIEHFKKSTEIRTDLAYISNALLAFSYYHLGDNKKAFIYHKKAIHQNPNYFYGYEFLRTFNKSSWKLEDIEKFELEQIDRFYNFYDNPENLKLIQFFESTWKYGFSELTVAHIYESLGIMLMNKEVPDYIKSAEYFKKAYETVPYINAYNLLGLSYYRSQKYVEAIQVFKDLNEFAPTHLQAYVILLSIYEEQGELEKGKIILMAYKNMLDFYIDNGYWNLDSYFAQSNFINENSEKDHNGAYKYYKNIFNK